MYVCIASLIYFLIWILRKINTSCSTRNSAYLTISWNQFNPSYEIIIFIGLREAQNLNFDITRFLFCNFILNDVLLDFGSVLEGRLGYPGLIGCNTDSSNTKLPCKLSVTNKESSHPAISMDCRKKKRRKYSEFYSKNILAVLSDFPV